MDPKDYDVYLQYADGREEILEVTNPDPNDGTICVHLPAPFRMTDIGDAWIRIVPKEW